MLAPASAIARVAAPISAGVSSWPRMVTTWPRVLGVGRGGDDVEIDLHALVPTEQQDVAEEISALGDRDGHPERELAANDDLLDVLHLGAGVGEHRHESGGHARMVGSGHADEDGLVVRWWLGGHAPRVGGRRPLDRQPLHREIHGEHRDPRKSTVMG